MKETAAEREARRNLVRIADMLETCETKKERAALMREYRASAKVLGIDIAAVKRKATAQFRAEHNQKCKEAALSVPQATRQAVLDMARAGGVTWKQVLDAFSLSGDALAGIIRMNTETIRYKRLREVAL